MKGSRQARNIGTDRVAMTHSKAASQCPKTGGFASSHPTMWCQAGDHRRGCRTGGEWTSGSTTEVYVRVRSLSRAVSGARRREAAWWHITCAYKEAPEVGLLPPEASGYQPHPLARPAQHRGGTAARFKPIPVENGIKAVSVSQQGGGKWRAVILERTYTAKPPAMQKTGGFAFSPIRCVLGANIVWGCRTGCKLNAPSPTQTAYARARALSRAGLHARRARLQLGVQIHVIPGPNDFRPASKAFAKFVAIVSVLVT
jgi:hypothetical protein